MAYRIEEISLDMPGVKSLNLIDLPQPLKGYDHFISSWCLKTPTASYLVDVGPAGTIPALLAALRQLEFRPDYILLTHVHLDHSGGLGQFLREFGQARVIVHPRGRAHLLEPSRLWQASLNTLGQVAEVYGRPEPVPETCFADELPEIMVLDTPGHAPHHLSFAYGELLFAGEAAGVFHNLAAPYLRPATPPRFFLKPALDSLDRLLAGNFHYLCYAHYGMTSKAEKLLRASREQLELWAGVLNKLLKTMPEAFELQIMDRAMKILLEQDRLFQSYRELPLDIQERERHFVYTNSFKGLIGCLKSQPLILEE